MAVQLFRKAALERLSTPEQLDRAVSVTSPKAWIALGLLMVIALAVLTWSIVGEIRTRVAANGILLVVGGQVLDAVATASGTLTNVAVGIGDSVKAGATIATVVNPEAVERHRGAVAALAERRSMHAALEASLRATDEASEAAAARPSNAPEIWSPWPARRSRPVGTASPTTRRCSRKRSSRGSRSTAAARNISRPCGSFPTRSPASTTSRRGNFRGAPNRRAGWTSRRRASVRPSGRSPNWERPSPPPASWRRSRGASPRSRPMPATWFSREHPWPVSRRAAPGSKC